MMRLDFPAGQVPQFDKVYSLEEFAQASECLIVNLSCLKRTYAEEHQSCEGLAEAIGQWESRIFDARPSSAEPLVFALWRGQTPFIGTTAHAAAFTFAHWSDPKSLLPGWTWDQAVDYAEWDQVELSKLVTTLRAERLLTLKKYQVTVSEKWISITKDELKRKLGIGKTTFRKWLTRRIELGQARQEKTTSKRIEVLESLIPVSKTSGKGA